VKRRGALLAIALLLAAPPSSAVVVSGGPRATPPAPDPGLANVAVIGGLSGVYLGDGWLLTARHVLAAAHEEKKRDVLLAGQRYQLLPDTTILVGSETEKPDLALVKIDGAPALAAIEISAATPAIGARLVLAGNGPLQEIRPSCRDRAGAVAAASAPGARCGFAWRKTPEGRTNGVQWGANQVASAPALLPGPQGAQTQVFATVFRDGSAGAIDQEAQAGVGDSGGPVFVQRGKRWELAGVMVAASAQSPTAATFGDRTYIADLSRYRAQILRSVGRE
jgi:hypothetical protein